MRQTVYCRACRRRHSVTYASGRLMAKCNGANWFVDHHPVTGVAQPITGMTKRTRDSVRSLRRKSAQSEGDPHA